MKKVFSWIVIGAGPAGIAAIGKLLDAKIKPETIGWVDPCFKVGDLGEKWPRVSSNTKVELFTRFLHSCDAFQYKKHGKSFALDSLDPAETCLLKEMVDPLQWVTNHLRGEVECFETTAMSLHLGSSRWEIATREEKLYAKNVVLATGSEPRQLSYPDVSVIPLDVALHPDKLKKKLKEGETVGVFGSSHSAVLILAHLCQLGVNTVNFYRSPHHYALDFGDWILFDNTGLKGYAAKWAKEHLDGKGMSCLTRVLVGDHLFEEKLALCDHVVYAVGFEKRKLPVLEQYDKVGYQDRTGIIAPGLFGIGIAFPQAQFDRLGNLEYRVGVWKFMDYLNTILPIWMKYSN